MNDYADRERCYLFVAMTELTLGQTDSRSFFLSQYMPKESDTLICSVERKLEKYIA